MGLTSVCDLTGVTASALVSERREGRADFAKALICGAIADTLVLGHGDLLYLPGLWVLDLRLNGDDLLVKPASFLGPLGSLV